MKHTTRTFIASGGRVVIPAHMRKAFGLEIGDEIAFITDETGIRIAPRNWAMKELQRLAAERIPASRRAKIVDEFIAERREEAKKEM